MKHLIDPEGNFQTFIDFLDRILGSVRGPVVLLDCDLKVVKANHFFWQTFKVKPEETEGFLIYDLGNRQWEHPKAQGVAGGYLASKLNFS